MTGHHYDRTGERIEEESPEPTGPEACREALAAALERIRCQFCGGQVKPGWTEHPSCRRLAEATS